MTNRRRFLSRTIGTAFAGAGLIEQSILRAAQVRASPPTPTKLFDIEKTADGIYLALSKPSPVINCNAAIFELSDGLLVVDSHSRPSAAAALIAQLKQEISPKPVRYLVNTHFHYDHAHGNAAYRKLKPKVDIVSSRTTREVLGERGAKAMAASLEQVRKSIDDAKASIEKASGAEAEFLKRGIADGEAFLKEMANAQPELPDITFEQGLTLHDKKQEIQLLFRGRAHTAGDICVYSPSKTAIATGDLLVGFIPGMGDGYPQEWPATLESLSELDFTQVLPGHGALQNSKGLLFQMRAYINEVTGLVTKGKAEGKSLEALQQSITPASLKTLGASGYSAYVMAMITRFRWLRPGADPALSLADAVKGNVTAVFEKTTAPPAR